MGLNGQVLKPALSRQICDDIAKEPGIVLISSKKTVHEYVNRGEIEVTPKKADPPCTLSDTAFQALCGASLAFT
jgi:hypothetical protein